MGSKLKKIYMGFRVLMSFGAKFYAFECEAIEKWKNSKIHDKIHLILK